MSTILELAQRVISRNLIATYYYDNTSWCQTFIGHSWETAKGRPTPNSYPSADAARRASTIVSTNPRTAPPGAIHYWTQNHVALATGPGAVRHIAATGRSAGATRSLGKSVYEHDTASYPLTYVGWSYGNGTREPITGFTDPYAVALKPNQRLTIVETRLRFEAKRVGDNYNPAANLPAGSVATPLGWINGEVIDGTGVWFKIADKQWAHASCFSDRGTHDLKDLNVYVGQRRVRDDIANARIRVAATTDSEQLAIIEPNALVAVTEFEVGQSVNSDNVTSNVWFVVAAPGGKPARAWAGSFTDSSTTGLKDITPTAPPPVDLTRKVVGTQGVNVRSHPSRSSAPVGSIPLGTEIVVSQYARGELVDGVDVWYLVTAANGVKGVSSATAFDSQSVAGLEYVDMTVPAQQYPDQPFSFVTDFPGVVDRVVAADWSNFENIYSVPDNPDGTNVRKGFPIKPAALVRHQWGAPGQFSLESVLNTFRARHLNSDDKVAPHFTVGINTLTGAIEIIQNVPLSARAYHAGACGNDFIGIEIDPRISDPVLGPSLIAAVRRLEHAISEKYAGRVPAVYHGDLACANTQCGLYIKPVASSLDAPFEGDGDTPPVDDKSVAAIIAAIEASEAAILEAVGALPTAEQNGAASRAAIVKDKE